MDEFVYQVLCGVLPVVVSAVVGLVVKLVMNGTVDDANNKASQAKSLVEEVLNYFDPRAQTSGISEEAYNKIMEHPTSYKMEQDAWELVYSTCASPEEIASVTQIIQSFESMMNPDFVVKTTSATYRVYYGVPQVIDSQYEYLTQSVIKEICDLSPNDTFLIMSAIRDAENAKTVEYDIPLKNCTIHIKNGQYTVYGRG